MTVQREDVSDLTEQLLDPAVLLFQQSSSKVAKTLTVKIDKLVVEKIYGQDKGAARCRHHTTVSSLTEDVL